MLCCYVMECYIVNPQIERIQSAGMWKSLQIKKQDMKLRNGPEINEMRLFHGACHTVIKTINEHGFNRSYAGKNGEIRLQISGTYCKHYTIYGYGMLYPRLC